MKFITQLSLTQYVIGAILLMSVTGSAQGVFYDDLNTWDLDSKQNIVVSGTNTTLPTSQPLVIGGDIADTTIITQPNSTSTTTNTSDPAITQETLIDPVSNSINNLTEIQRDAEFLLALRWLYDLGLTKFQQPQDYMPDNYLSRIDAAKMLSILSRKVFELTKTNDETCAYTDIINYDDTSKGQVKDACKLGIFRSADIFNPNQGITKGQLITVLIRMFDMNKQDETTDPWYKNYVLRAQQIGLINDKSLAGMDDTVTRADVAKMLYKLRNIYLNKSPITKDKQPVFINVISQDSDLNQFQATIDASMIRDDALQTLQMKLDMLTYYFGKSKVYNYGATLSNYQVYGYLYATSDSLTPIGVGTWRVQQSVIQEGKLIIWGDEQTTYTITPNEEATLYTITKTN